MASDNSFDGEIDALVANARGDSVTRDVLTDSGTVGGGLLTRPKSYNSIVAELQDGEQPHFVNVIPEAPHRIGTPSKYEKGYMKRTVVTDRRILFVSTAHRFSVAYPNVTTVEEGDMTLAVTDSSGETHEFPMWPKSERKMAADYVSNRQGRSSPSADALSQQSAVERLSELEALRAQGLVSVEEFERKRREILDDL